MENTKDQYSERLIMKARAGNNNSFHELSNMLMLKIYPLIFSLVPREEVASKILLKVLLRAKNNIHKLEKETHFLVWLRKVSVIECFHYLKDSKPVILTRLEVEDFCHNEYRNLSNVEKEFLLLSGMERITLAMSDILEISSDQISRIMRNFSEKDVSESIRNTRDELIRKFPFEEVKDFNDFEWSELNQNLLKLDEGSNLDLSDSELEILDKYLTYSKSILGGILKHLSPTDRILFELREELLKISYSSILKEQEEKDRKEENKIRDELNPQFNNNVISSNWYNLYSSTASMHELFVNHSKKMKSLSLVLTLSTLIYFGFFTLFGSTPSWKIEKSIGIITVNSNSGTNNELDDGDIISTGLNASLSLKSSNAASLEVFSDTKLKIVDVSSTNSILELLSGKITFNSRETTGENIISEEESRFVIRSANANIFTTFSDFEFENREMNFDLTVFDGWLKLESNSRNFYLVKNYKYTQNFAAPYHINASKEIVESLSRVKLNESDLSIIIRYAEEKDAITLWHLLSQTDSIGRETILEKLNEYYPISSIGVREGILKLDDLAMTNLQEFLYHNITRDGS